MTTETAHRISTYRKGKLYRVAHYFHHSIALYSPQKAWFHGVGMASRTKLASWPMSENLTFLYLDYIPNPGPEGDWDYFLVICQDMVGVVDARIFLEEIRDPEDENESDL